MDPTTVCCPNLAGPARGRGGQRNIGIPSRTDKRFMCTPCRKTFAETTGTVCSRLRTPPETVTRVITLLAPGCPLHAMAVACGFAARTVADGVVRPGLQGHAVQEQRVEQPRDVGQVPADAIRVKKPGGVVWMALAMMVRTRVWRAGEGRAHRAMPLIRRLIARVHACAVPCALLGCTDG